MSDLNDTLVTTLSALFAQLLNHTQTESQQSVKVYRSDTQPSVRGLTQNSSF